MITAENVVPDWQPDVVWNGARETLRGMLKPDIFNLWFAGIQASHDGNGSLQLHVPNDFCVVWLTENYLGLIRDVVTHVAARSIEVEIVATTAAAPEIVSEEKSRVAPPAERSPVETEKPARASAQVNDALFNPKSTFESFVVGNNNTFAHAASVAVAQQPGRSYNPLFLYGGVGLGKTHLLHAIGQYVVAHRKGARVAYLSSERFTNEYIDAIQNSSLVRFRRKYRHTDVLLIDDIQFLAGKERIQEEFFHTFNTLHEAHKQIVLTSDRPASEVQGLEQRLVSRFEWGLVTDLQPPDIETRLAILRKKERDLGIQIGDEVMNFLAARVRSNIRRLEGALIRVASYAQLTGKTISVPVAEKLLREILHEEGRAQLTVEMIQKKVAEHFDIRLADMTSKRRPENIAFPRQIAMSLTRQMTELSLNAIGEAFGGRDHGTVMHACQVVRNRMDTDTQVRQTVLYLQSQLQR